MRRRKIFFFPSRTVDSARTAGYHKKTNDQDPYHSEGRMQDARHHERMRAHVLMHRTVMPEAKALGRFTTPLLGKFFGQKKNPS